MKILVLSDTHGDLENLDKVVERSGDIDLLIHLGDNTKDALKIKEILNTKMINVKGNCDIFDKVTPKEEIIEIRNKKLFLTHGDDYGVKSGINKIYYRALELEVDIVLFGHSHVSTLVREDNILFLNPGSISLPRGGSKKSFGIIEIKEDVLAKIIEIE